MNIKETMDLLQVLEVIARCYVQAKADGSINWLDLPKFMPALGALAEAFSGIEKLEGEMKDLDMSELLLIGQKLRDIGAIVKGV